MKNHWETVSIRYPLYDPLHDHPEQYLLVSTTRPETMLGDAAVAIHPR